VASTVNGAVTTDPSDSRNLAAAGHVAVMRADGSTFAHEHAEVTDDRGRPEIRAGGDQVHPGLVATGEVLDRTAARQRPCELATSSAGRCSTPPAAASVWSRARATRRPAVVVRRAQGQHLR
jgi:hypothetical protein